MGGSSPCADRARSAARSTVDRPPYSFRNRVFTRLKIACAGGADAGDLRARTITATFLAIVKVSLEEFSLRKADSDFMTVFHDVLDADAAVLSMR